MLYVIKKAEIDVFFIIFSKYIHIASFISYLKNKRRGKNVRERKNVLKILLTPMSTKLSWAGQNGCSSGRKGCCYKSNPVRIELWMSDHAYQTWLQTKAHVVN